MCRRAALATLLVVVATLSAASSAHAQSASLLSGHRGDSPRTVKSVCTMPTLICSAGSLVGIGGDVGGAAVGAAGDIAGDAIGGAADSVMNGVVSWAADGAAWLVR